VFKILGRSGAIWLGVVVASIAMIAGAIVAGAAVVGKVHGRHHGAVICRHLGRRTVQSHGTEYIVRNDVFFPERECIELPARGLGFKVISSRAHSTVGDTDAFPEVVYGCEWGLCSPQTKLPKRVFRLRALTSSWSTSWRQSPGHFDVGYDIWLGRLHTVNGQSKGAELMIWLGTKGFGTPYDDPVVTIGHARWYYARHLACNQFGCWNYVLFRRVVPTAHVKLNLLPFIRYAVKRHQIKDRWYLKSVNAGFEIWREGTGLAVHSFAVHVRVKGSRQRLHRVPGH
jgi:hypothetical protein